MPLSHWPSVSQRVDEFEGNQRTLSVLVIMWWRDNSSYICKIQGLHCRDISLLHRVNNATNEYSLKRYHQYGQDDSLYNYLLSAYHIEGMSELAVKHRDKVKLYEAPTGVENVQTILEAIDKLKGIECDYNSFISLKHGNNVGILQQNQTTIIMVYPSLPLKEWTISGWQNRRCCQAMMWQLMNTGKEASV